MACRDMKKCEKVRENLMSNSCNRQIVCKKVDLASLKSVREFAQDINESMKTNIDYLA